MTRTKLTIFDGLCSTKQIRDSKYQNKTFSNFANKVEKH